MNELEKAKQYGCDLHDLRNYKYGEYPYSKHLEMVYEIAKKYIYLIPEKWKNTVLCTAWLHDTIEDCGITYNDIKFRFNVQIAENVIALTNDIRGRTRKERAESSYQAIKENKYANFIKICDRIANMTFSKSQGSSMYDKYKKEHDDFYNAIYIDSYGFDEMWDELKSI